MSHAPRLPFGEGVNLWNAFGHSEQIAACLLQPWTSDQECRWSTKPPAYYCLCPSREVWAVMSRCAPRLSSMLMRNMSNAMHALIRQISSTLTSVHIVLASLASLHFIVNILTLGYCKHYRALLRGPKNLRPILMIMKRWTHIKSKAYGHQISNQRGFRSGPPPLTL